MFRGRWGGYLGLVFLIGRPDRAVQGPLTARTATRHRRVASACRSDGRLFAFAVLDSAAQKAAAAGDAAGRRIAESSVRFGGGTKDESLLFGGPGALDPAGRGRAVKKSERSRQLQTRLTADDVDPMVEVTGHLSNPDLIERLRGLAK